MRKGENNMSKVKALLPNRQETELEIEEVTLLSVDEATKIPKRLLKSRDYWWLCSPGRLCDFSVVACVDGDDGYIYDDGLFVKYAHDIRPALRVKNLGSLNLKVGAVVRINDCSYYVIPGNTLLSKKYIGECSFRKDWKAPDANVYEKSDIKKFVDDWAVKQGFTEAADVKEVAKQEAYVIPVVVTYSFDEEASVYLCTSDEEAEDTLWNDFQEELRIESEENKRIEGEDMTVVVTDSHRYASITIERADDTKDVTKWHIGTV
jgi:hypothetical protein